VARFPPISAPGCGYIRPKTTSLMYEGGEAVTTFSVQRRPLLSLSGG